MYPSKYTKLLAAVGISLAFACSASAQVLFNVDFESPTYTIGNNYTVTAGVGTNTSFLGALPNHVTNATDSGTWAAAVESNGAGGQRLSLSGTTASGNSGFSVLNNQSAPGSAQTWFVQFDYTRLATTTGILGVNFLNASGLNMLGHPNNATFYPTQFTVGAGAPTLAVNSTTTLRIEIDSGTTTVRTYANGILFDGGLAASSANAFGGVNFHFIDGNAGNDWKIDNISGGVVPEPSTWILAALGLTVALTLRRRRMA